MRGLIWEKTGAFHDYLVNSLGYDVLIITQAQIKTTSPLCR
jgi:hypothetical protein